METNNTSTIKIITTYNKKMGYYYVHEDSHYWNKELRQTRHIRKTIGKKLTEDGDIIYNDRYKLEHPELKIKKKNSMPAVSTTKSIGEIKLLDSVITDLNLKKPLVTAFGNEKAAIIIDLAKYQICTEKALSWAGSWADDKDISISDFSSQSISKILANITHDQQNIFYKHWMKLNKCDQGYFCFDSTNIAAYNTENDPLIDYGYTHGHIQLPQANLAILSRQDTLIPVQSLLYNGSRHDSSTIENLIEGLNKLELNNICLTLDKGYYSDKNIEAIIRSKNSVIIPIPKRVLWQRELIDSLKSKLNSLDATIEVENDKGEVEEVYCVRKCITRNNHRYYVYVVYNPQIRADAEIRFRKLISSCQKELLTSRLVESHSEYYNKYFEVNNTAKKGKRVIEKIPMTEDIKNSYAGYWCLLSNEKRPCIEIYNAYKGRNTAEIFYDTIKNDLNGDRVRSHSQKTFEGKMFITFISLIILIRLKKLFAEKKSGNQKLNRIKSYRDLLLRMSNLTEVSFVGKYKPLYTTPNKMQREILDKFGINWPN